MYILSQKGKDSLNNDRFIRRAVAMAMGIGENAVNMAVKKYDGRSIANHYDGLNMLSDKTGIAIKNLRQVEPENKKP